MWNATVEDEHWKTLFYLWTRLWLQSYAHFHGSKREYTEYTEYTEYKKWINMHRIVLCHIFKNMLIATIVSFLTPKCIQFHQPFYTGSTFQIFDLFLLTSYQFKSPTQLVASSMRQHKKHEWMTILPRQQPRSSQFPISHILSLNLFLSDCLIAVKVVYGQSSLIFKMSMLQRQLNGKPKHPRL